MQYLYEKIRNLSLQIVFKKYNHELVMREKPSPCLSRAKSKNLPWLHYQHLQIATKSMHRTSATPKSIQYLYQKIRNLSLQIVFKKYNHELVREKPSPCLTEAKSKNLPWLRYPTQQKGKSQLPYANFCSERIKIYGTQNMSIYPKASRSRVAFI